MTWLGPALLADAQALMCKTNSYDVYGVNMREIMQSIRQAKPWREPYDGMTTWNIRCSFSTVGDPSGCRVTGLQVITTITTTLPRWRKPTNAEPGTLERWLKLHTRLAAHENGHAKLAREADAEVRRRVSAINNSDDCATLQRQINDTVQDITDDYRRREVEYDRRTAHGTRD